MDEPFRWSVSGPLKIPRLPELAANNGAAPPNAITGIRSISVCLLLLSCVGY